MRVGILTFHAGPNYGAYFQALALQSFVNSMGHEAFIIDYRNPTLLKNELLSLLPLRPLRMLPFFILRLWPSNLIRLMRFLRAHKRFNLILKKNLTHKSLSVIIVGSDEVWNLQNPLFGFDPTLFADFWKKHKIGYAICTGTSTAATQVPNHLVRKIYRFNNISVRDQTSKDFLSKHYKRKINIVLDPTFFANYNLYVAQTSLKILREKKYLVVYGYELSEDTILDTIAFARKYSLLTVALGYYNRWCNLNYTSAGPFEFLGAMKGASAVITTMYHGALFSIHFQRTFAVELTPYRKNKFSHLKTWKPFSRRIITMKRSAAVILNEPVDWKSFKRKIDHEKKQSAKYLNRALSKIQC